ncbi:hypothetical protein SELMODRAFT_404606 [Selaginella moellendorffii]|uniref:Uncharacterized protein n=1 Tax=Selaginella moellendorffii TaxID=88036 RepID=D8QVV2_SELML|nr:hypothetical protein SELMODRAFT_404606 [Selaginella moellendorffii]
MVSCIPRRLVGTSKLALLELAYNRAVCLYHLKHYGPEILEHGVRQYPELSIGSHVKGIELCSVGNSPELKESALVEAFNLKAAIDYVNGNLEAAKENLTDMPPQTLANLLLLYCKPSHGFYDLATDVMAEHAEVIFKYLSQDFYDFINCIILTKTSPEDAYQKMNELANHYSETMRRLTKQIQDCCLSRNQKGHKKALAEYEDSLEYNPYKDFLMSFCRWIFFDYMAMIWMENSLAKRINPDETASWDLFLLMVNILNIK